MKTCHRIGVTLVELLIAMAIFSLVIALSLRLYVTTYQSFGRQESRLRVVSSRQAALGALRQDVRLAQAVRLEALDGGGQRLVLAMPGEAQQVEYRAEKGRLERREVGKVAAEAAPTTAVASKPVGSKLPPTRQAEVLVEGDQVTLQVQRGPRGPLVWVAFAPVPAQNVPALTLALHPRNAL